MVNASPKSMGIQILLSILLILSGLVAIYLIHRAHSESAQVTFYDSSDGLETVESEQSGSMFYTGSADGEDEPRKTPDTRHETQNRDTLKSSKSLKSLNVERGTTSTTSGFVESRVLSLESTVKRLEKLKYDGYMWVGDMKIAWLSDGEGRIAVGEGRVLDDTIRIDEIHENFLLVSAADGHIVRKIAFTRSPGERGPKIPSSTTVIARSSGSGSRITTARSVSTTASQDKSAAGSSDRTFPPSSQYGPPPIPGQISPDVAQRGGREDVQGSDYGTLIYTDPALKTVTSAGETFAVQVKIDNGSNVFAVPFDINYDPNVLEAVGLYEGSYLKKDGGQTTFLTSIDRDKGKITIGLTRLGRIGGVSGSGTLMSIAFRALKSGTAFLSFANGQPMDPKLNVLPVRFVRGRVKVK